MGHREREHAPPEAAPREASQAGSDTSPKPPLTHSTVGRITGMSKPTSIKTSEAVRDRLRTLAEDRGTTITELLEELAARELTAAEREQRAREAAHELGNTVPETIFPGWSASRKVRSSGFSQARADKCGSPRHRPISSASSSWPISKTSDGWSIRRIDASSGEIRPASLCPSLDASSTTSTSDLSKPVTVTLRTGPGRSLSRSDCRRGSEPGSDMGGA